ncbi:MAG TPA: SGNH/GDSL hydrolase family protein [Vicinamibacteria bacterium]
MKRTRITWMAVVVAAWAAAATGGEVGTDGAPAWVATWGASPMDSGPRGPARAFANETIRQVVHISVGGRALRVRFSNAFGSEALRIGAARIALHAGGPAIVPGSDRALTFSGRSSIKVPTGAVAVSDPVALSVPAQANLAVSLYLPEDTGAATFHDFGNQTAYISPPGDFTGEVTLPVATTSTQRYFLSVVEVLPRDRVGAVVALGDSITDGAASTFEANRRWVDVLSARLNPVSGRPRLGVVNEGIGCGRLLRDFCGPNGSGRFDRDVLAVTGANHVIMALGLVDIILPTSFGVPDQIVSADEIILGQKQVVERAHAQGLKIYGATIVPFGNSTFPGVFTPENEAKRQAVNHWIRTSGAFDGVIDFDRAIRDPADPTRMLDIYSSADGVHPSDAGHQAMANSIDLSLLR